MGLQVVGVGLGRTGTNSLKLALEQLLGGRCHHMHEVFERPELMGLWTEATGRESRLGCDLRRRRGHRRLAGGGVLAGARRRVPRRGGAPLQARAAPRSGGRAPTARSSTPFAIEGMPPEIADLAGHACGPSSGATASIPDDEAVSEAAYDRHLARCARRRAAPRGWSSGRQETAGGRCARPWASPCPRTPSPTSTPRRSSGAAVGLGGRGSVGRRVTDVACRRRRVRR